MRGRIHGAIDVGAGGPERIEDASGVGEKRRVEECPYRRGCRQADQACRLPVPASESHGPTIPERPPGDGAGREGCREHDGRRLLARDGQAGGHARQHGPFQGAFGRQASERDRERQRKAGKQGLLDVHPGVEDHRGRQREQDRAGRDGGTADAGRQQQQEQNRPRAERRPSRHGACVRRARPAWSGRATTRRAERDSRGSGRGGRGSRSGTRRARAARRT